MIASVNGRVAAVTAEAAVVEVGGVGLLVHCAPATLAGLRVGEPASLATSLVVREDALTLYGFADAAERALFELLQTAGGVGPRLAQAVLAVLSPTAVRTAIATEDVTALTRVPGIGKKGAQRIVLELKDKVGAVADIPAPARAPLASVPAAWHEQVRAALTGLGYSAREAEDAVARVAEAEPDVADDQPDVAVLLRSALRTLTRV
jgi:Holliday junction DNA helicase RuvA